MSDDQAVATHEAAHAVIARFLKHPVTRASLDGVTTQYRTDDRMALFHEAVIGAAGPAGGVTTTPAPAVRLPAVVGWRVEGRPRKSRTHREPPCCCPTSTKPRGSALGRHRTRGGGFVGARVSELG